MKSCKASGLDGFPVECLKKGMAVLEWLVGVSNLSFDMEVVPMDYQGACIVAPKRETVNCNCIVVQREG